MKQVIGRFDNGQLFINGKFTFTSPSLETWLSRYSLRKFTVVPRIARADQVLKLLAIDDHGKAVVICHYVLSGEWEGSITICRKGLVELFGRVPKTLSITEVE